MTETAALAYFQAIIDDVEIPPFEFEIKQFEMFCFLRAKLWRLDTHTKKWGYGYSAWYPLAVTMEIGEIAKKPFVAARDFAEHEVREAYTYKGRKVLSPHINIDKLWEAAEGA